MQLIKKLKIDPNRYNLDPSDGPNNARNEPESMKQWIYLIYPFSCTRDQETRT